MLIEIAALAVAAIQTFDRAICRIPGSPRRIPAAVPNRLVLPEGLAHEAVQALAHLAGQLGELGPQPETAGIKPAFDAVLLAYLHALNGWAPPSEGA
ncbi:MAG: hypothetical protein HQL37_15795 [Alphaproteobacteria bacterium]|nr:hypothetical protein [Alphaproteobacteria bacterium]